MDFTRDRMEQVVLGTILNDNGNDGFVKSCHLSLKKELFKDRRNAFIFGVIDSMYKNGLSSFLPADIVEYADKNGIKYGNAANFCNYMCSLALNNYAFNDFRKYVRELVKKYVRESKDGAVR